MDAFNLSHFVLVCIPALLLNKVYTKKKKKKKKKKRKRKAETEN